MASNFYPNRRTAPVELAKGQGIRADARKADAPGQSHAINPDYRVYAANSATARRAIMRANIK